ncbi:MAG: hypothetical protein JJK57_05200 [Komagataeibacter hansenii]|nr:hypothetical protein [Novacetimonas hansenii]
MKTPEKTLWHKAAGTSAEKSWFPKGNTLWWGCGGKAPECRIQRVFENNPLINNMKNLWVPPFSKKAVSFEAFWKKLHQKPL